MFSALEANSLWRQVETTLQKSIFRVFGTVLGGALGFAAMTDTRSAQNPYALMAILCTIAFFASFLTNSPVGISSGPSPNPDNNSLDSPTSLLILTLDLALNLI